MTNIHIQYDFYGRGISQLQRPLPDNTQQSQKTDIHAVGGIRNRRPSGLDPSLRPRGYQDRPLLFLPPLN
jgi:hypothetical protein